MKEQPELSALLENLPVPPSRITAEDAVRFGQSSRRHRRSAVAGIGAATLVVALGVAVLTRPATLPQLHNPPSTTPSATPSPANPWSLKELPMPAGVNPVWFIAMDPTGRHLVGINLEGLVLWRDGVPEFLPKPAGWQQILVCDVNSSGVIVGSANTETGPKFGWVMRDGVATNLPEPADSSDGYGATRINTRGDIIGNAGETGNRAILWSADDPSTPQVLTGGTSYIVAHDINDAGTIVGQLGDGDHPYAWDAGGVGRRLPEQAGKPGGKAIAVAGNWAGGWVPAEGRPNLRAARWNLATGELVVFPGGRGVADSIAENGTIVSYVDEPYRPVVISPAGLITALPGPAGLRRQAFAINAAGTVVAGIVLTDTGSTPVIWQLG